MKYTVFGKEVEFTDKEMEIFRNAHLDVDGGFLEFLLMQIDVNEFNENSSDEEKHDLCINAIKDYANVVENTLEWVKRDGYL